MVSPCLFQDLFEGTWKKFEEITEVKAPKMLIWFFEKKKEKEKVFYHFFSIMNLRKIVEKKNF